MYKKINDNNSIFNLNYYSHVRWWNILGHIKRLYHMLKNVYFRGRYGFAPYDVWNLDSYIAQLLHDALIFMRDNGVAYPGDKCMDTPEKWHKYLTEMADAFQYAAFYNDEESTKHYENYWSAYMEWGNDDPKTQMAYEEYKKAYQEFQQRKERAKNKACDMLKERFFDLWD